MSDQPLDLRRIATIMRRRKFVVLVSLLLGLGTGITLTVVSPPLKGSYVLVVLPQSTQLAVRTQVVVATSEPVLSGAARQLRPPPALQTLRTRVTASALTYDVIAITGHSRTAREARAMATAVANSYVSYVSASDSAVGRVQAHRLGTASAATGTPLPLALVIVGGIGLLLGLLVGVIVAVAVGRGDRRMRTRDEIANAIGVPVLASLAAAHRSSAGAWTRLFDEYKASASEAWALRKALSKLRLADPGPGRERSVAVLSLSSDPAALAVGPQLALFAASLGIPTTLVVGLQQDVTATATLRAACAARADGDPGRSASLQVVVRDRNTAGQPSTGRLTILIITIDGRAPKVVDPMPTSASVIAVSANGATAEELARVAAGAAADGRNVAGILLANPDPDDETTGRFPALTGVQQGLRPARLTALTLENRL